MDTKENAVMEEVTTVPAENLDVPADATVADLAGFIVTKEDVLQPVLLNQSNVNDGTHYAQGFAY